MPLRTKGPLRLMPCLAAPGGLSDRTPGPFRVWLLALALCAALSACGLKTPPKPLSEVVPPTADVGAWQRERDIIVSWLPPSPNQEEKYGGLRGYELWFQPRPLLCLDCPPESPTRVRLKHDDPSLHLESGKVFYQRPLGPDVGQVNVRVSTWYGVGLGPGSEAVQVERAGAIPAPVLQWRWVIGPKGMPQRSVLFYWQAVQERIVQIIGRDAVPHEEVQDYRANLYRRVPPAPWPILPVNSEPITVAHWIVPPLGAPSPSSKAVEAFQLRLVDQFGNEGPPSLEVRIPLAGPKRNDGRPLPEMQVPPAGPKP